MITADLVGVGADNVFLTSKKGGMHGRGLTTFRQ